MNKISWNDQIRSFYLGRVMEHKMQRMQFYVQGGYQKVFKILGNPKFLRLDEANQEIQYTFRILGYLVPYNPEFLDICILSKKYPGVDDVVEEVTKDVFNKKIKNYGNRKKNYSYYYLLTIKLKLKDIEQKIIEHKGFINEKNFIKIEGKDFIYENDLIFFFRTFDNYQFFINYIPKKFRFVIPKTIIKRIFEIRQKRIKENNKKQLSIYAPAFFPIKYKSVFEKKVDHYVSNNQISFPYSFNINTISLPKQGKEINEKRLVTFNTYYEVFRNLLWQEKEKTIEDIKDFDMHEVEILAKNEESKFVSIIVEGIQDNRPPLRIGDTVICRYRDSPNGMEIRSRIVDIRYNTVYFVLDRTKLLPEVFHVRFEIDQTFFEVMQNTLSNVFSKKSNSKKKIIITNPNNRNSKPKKKEDEEPILKRILFPKIEYINQIKERNLYKTPEDIEYCDKELNEEQKEVIFKFLNNSCGNIAQIVSGPFGTGKTRNLLECIRQVILHKNKGLDGQILVVTPSLSSADGICLKLIDFCKQNKCKMLRLNHFKRLGNTIKGQLVPYCLKDSKGFFTIPTYEEIQKYDIIITNTITSAVIKQIGLKSFKFIIFDESAQAIEPEMLIPLQYATKESQILMFGDHFQLGPAIRLDSRILELSLHERLVSTRSVYMSNTVKDRCYSMLTKNYRSHPEIIKVPSELFYGGKLEIKSDEKITKSLVNWCGLPNKENFPLCFCEIKGKDYPVGTSYCNPLEAVQVFYVVRSLLEDKSVQVNHEDIGIIAPYRKQVEYLRLLFRENNLQNIDIGTVLDYQGKEKKIIILSTTRTYISASYSKDLGIINNPKKFNVAVSRAQSLLVILGDPEILSIDYNWIRFLYFVWENKAYLGTVPKNLLELFESEKINSKSSSYSFIRPQLNTTKQIHFEQSRESKFQLNDDKPWRIYY